MVILIGIDDTDNLNSRGTGFRARTLGFELSNLGFGTLRGVSRHQLFVNPLIPYTSHNSSLCIEFDALEDDADDIIAYSKEFLELNSAEGSDPGLCVTYLNSMPLEVILFGQLAKTTVLTKQDAVKLADKHFIHLSEHGGTGDGIIGALAAVGLRASGNDGRFVWAEGIREMAGLHTSREILLSTGVESILAETGEVPHDDDIIDIGDWFRPVLLNNKKTLLVEHCDTQKARWKILDREKIKSKY